MSPTMKKYVTDFTGLDNLKLETCDVPDMSKFPPTHVLVKIHAVSLNYRDFEAISGDYKHHGLKSDDWVVPCADAAGEIVAYGTDSSSVISTPDPEPPRFSTGDRVFSIFCEGFIKGTPNTATMKTGLGMPLQGVLQEYRVFNEQGLMPIPKHLDFVQASTVSIAGATAWSALYNTIPLKPGDTVLILGTGGVAIYCLQFALAAGAKVIITSSSDSKLAAATALGATHTINYNTHPDWEKEVLRLTDGEGANQVIENAGEKTLMQSFASIAWGGLVNAVGYVSGKGNEQAAVGLCVMALRRNVTYKGVLIGPRDPDYGHVVRLMERNNIVPVVDKVFSFEQAVDAFKYLQSGQHMGKIVVTVSQ